MENLLSKVGNKLAQIGVDGRKLLCRFVIQTLLWSKLLAHLIPYGVLDQGFTCFALLD